MTTEPLDLNDLNLRLLQLKSRGYDIHQEVARLQELASQYGKEQNAVHAEIQKVSSVINQMNEVIQNRQIEEKEDIKQKLDTGNVENGCITLENDPNMDDVKQDSLVTPPKKKTTKKPATKTKVKQTTRKPKTAHSIGGSK